MYAKNIFFGGILKECILSVPLKCYQTKLTIWNRNDRLLVDEWQNSSDDVHLCFEHVRCQKLTGQVPSVEETDAYRFNTLHLMIWHAIWSPAVCTRGKRPSTRPLSLNKRLFCSLWKRRCFKSVPLCASVEILWSTAVRSLPLFPKSVVNLKNAGISAVRRVQQKAFICTVFELDNVDQMHCFTSSCKHACYRYLQPSDVDCDNDCSTYELKICGSVPGPCIFSKPCSVIILQL